MQSRIALSVFISVWAGTASAHNPPDPHWKPEPLSIATLISLNGLLCSEVIRSTPLKKADMHAVVCKTGNGKSAAYIFDAKTGKARVPE